MILGVAGCGKSTLLKQIKFLNTGSFFEGEEEGQVDFVTLGNQNLLVGMQNLLRWVKELELSLEDKNLKHERYISQLSDVSHHIPVFHEKVKQLWNDEAIQEVWQKRSTLPIQIKTMQYLIENMHRFNPETTENFVPTNEDVLYLRQRTTGIVTVRFASDRSEWEFVDIGGQRPEREKWLQIVDEGIDALLYMVALDEFCVPCTEDNRFSSNLQFSRNIFKELLKHPNIQTLPKIVLLNKHDAFMSVHEQPHFWDSFQKQFPTFSLTPQTRTPAAALEHIASQFKKLNRDIIVQSGCCLNKDYISTLYSDISDIILNGMLDDNGLGF
uniref:Uncharacterized protein n=1 Tax=Arcella intermedia TaxID=1963864 RepID=A0A6B2LAE0_9EUKA